MVDLQDIMETLALIEQDMSVPKNIRTRVKSAIIVLTEQPPSTINVAFDKVIQELDELNEDPNVPVYTRAQIWSVVSSLESR